MQVWNSTDLMKQKVSIEIRYIIYTLLSIYYLLIFLNKFFYEIVQIMRLIRILQSVLLERNILV